MRIKFLIVIFLLSNILLKADTVTNSLLNKRLNYNLEFKNIPSGNAYIEVNKDSLNNNGVLKLRSEIKTNKFLDVFYRIRDDISIYMNDNNFSLLKVISTIKEGNYTKNHEAFISIDKKKIISGGAEQEINGEIYSPLSIIFSLRNKNLHVNDEYFYTSYSMGDLKDIGIHVKKKEITQTPYGIFETIVVTPKSNNKNNIFKNNGDMKIWYTNDDDRIPIKIEIKITHGSIVLLLNNIK